MVSGYYKLKCAGQVCWCERWEGDRRAPRALKCQVKKRCPDCGRDMAVHGCYPEFAKELMIVCPHHWVILPEGDEKPHVCTDAMFYKFFELVERGQEKPAPKLEKWGTCDHCGSAREKDFLEDDGAGLRICDRCRENLGMCPTCQGQGHYIKSVDEFGSFGGTCRDCEGKGWVKKELLCEHDSFDETCSICHPEEE
jgi:hypothetical protein